MVRGRRAQSAISLTPLRPPPPPRAHLQPTDANIDTYLKEMASANVAHLVRATESGYSAARVEAAGIKVHDMAFTDGEPPPESIISRWLALCADTFKGDKRRAIAVHCIAGLGRAPVLVSIALIEDGLDGLDAVELIRSKRRGAVNVKQVRGGGGGGGGRRHATGVRGARDLPTRPPPLHTPPQLTYLEHVYQRRSGKGKCVVA